MGASPLFQKLYQEILRELKEAAGGRVTLSPSEAAGHVTGARRETTCRQLAAGKFDYPTVIVGGKKVVPIHLLAIILAGGALPSLTETSSLNGEINGPASCGVPKNSKPENSKKGPGRPQKYSQAQRRKAANKGAA